MRSAELVAASRHASRRLLALSLLGLVIGLPLTVDAATSLPAAALAPPQLVAEVTALVAGLVLSWVGVVAGLALATRASGPVAAGATRVGQLLTWGRFERCTGVLVGAGILLGAASAAASASEDGGGGHTDTVAARTVAAPAPAAPDPIAPAPTWTLPEAVDVPLPGWHASPATAAAGTEPAGRAPSGSVPWPGWVAPPTAHRDRADVSVLVGRRDVHAGAQVVVAPGDSLWRIARRHLPEHASSRTIARAVARWHAANREVVGADPDVLVTGTTLVVPR